MLRLLVDTCCDLSESIKNHPALDIVSLNVIIDGKSYRDQKEITTDEITEKLNQGIMPGTSQVLPGDFKAYFEEQAKAGNEVLYLAFTSKLSGTCHTGQMILNEVKEEYPDFKAAVVDSEQSGGPIGLIAEQLLHMMDRGATLDEIKKAAEVFRKHVYYLFTMQNLKWLAKGGRLNKATAMLGDLLKIRPVILVEDGEMKLLAKARGDNKAMREVKAILESKLSDFRDQRVGIGVCDPESCLVLTEKMEAIAHEEGIRDTERIRIGTVLSAHLGTTGTGIFFWDQDPNLLAEQYGLTCGGDTIKNLSVG